MFVRSLVLVVGSVIAAATFVPDLATRYLAATGKAPEEVKVEVKEGENSTIIELTVAPDDMGKVIGKQGRIAKAIRTVVKAASVKENKKYVVEIV